MKLVAIPLWLLWVLTTVVGAAPIESDPQVVASRQITNLQKRYYQNVHAVIKTRKTGCTAENIVYRQEWGTLSKQARFEYISAVQCLQRKAPFSSKSDAPGARNRYDDFVATHIKRTNNVHFSGLFLPFHRYFTWLYEKTLREECGYKGSQPYWDWTLAWEDPRKSTVFDGSPYSMGSNGKAVSHGPTTISAFGITLEISPGTGGGCTYQGPFTNYTVNLGPVAFEPRGPNGGLGYNPRCLARDISLEWSNKTKPTDVAYLLEGAGCKDIGCLDDKLEDINGVHSSGHISMGGLGVDAFAAAGDPVFWLHHAQVDRMWSIWQGLDLQNRTKQVSGTQTAFNNPPSANVTLNTNVDFGIIAPQQRVDNIVSTIDGPMCYMYI